MFGIACSRQKNSRLSPGFEGGASNAALSVHPVFMGMITHAMLASETRIAGAPVVVENLRHTSLRPSVVVDPAAFGVVDPANQFIGRPAPLGRERCLFALPLSPGPSLVSPPTVVRDAGSAFLADPQGALIGTPAVWVSRMHTARWVEDTRRLAG